MARDLIYESRCGKFWLIFIRTRYDFLLIIEVGCFNSFLRIGKIWPTKSSVRKYLRSVIVVMMTNVFYDCKSFKIVLFIRSPISSPGFTSMAARR
jgi:hypothetical protein